MASEALRGALRVTANYGRQGLTLLLNVVLIALLWGWLGKDGVGLVMLISATVGSATIVDEVIRSSMIRELGAAYHSGRPAEFSRIYDAAWVLSTVATLICALVFVLLVVFVRLFHIPPELVGAARVMLAAEGIFTCVFLLVAPATNMYIVQERFVADNLWTTARRLGQTLAAFGCARMMPATDTATAICCYAVLYTSINVLLTLVAAGLIVTSDARYVPAPWRATRGAIRDILGTFGWNTGVTVALHTYERVPAFVMNALFGLGGSAIYGLAIQMASYIRMLTLGLSSGLDAVSARISQSNRRGEGASLTQVTRAYTMLHAIAALPGAAVLLFLTRPIVEVWLGSRMDDPARMLPLIVTMVPLLILPVTVRSISDCWIRILYGAGAIHRLGPVVILGGLISPAVIVILCWLLPDGPLRFVAPAAGFAAVFTVFHMFLIPVVAARALHTAWRSLLAPVTGPVLVAAVCSPLLLLGRAAFPTPGPVSLAAIVGLFGAVYAGMTFLLVLPKEHKRQMAATIAARMGWSKERDESPRAAAMAMPSEMDEKI